MHIRIRIAAQAETWSLRIEAIVVCMRKIMTQIYFECKALLQIVSRNHGIGCLSAWAHNDRIKIDVMGPVEHKGDNFRDISRDQWFLDAFVNRVGLGLISI